MFAGNYAPRNHAFCNGQILTISQNTALFSILGTTYGGNGQTTFALPDLRGRIPIQAGQGPGLSSYFLGDRAGQEAVALTQPAMPAHAHALNASSASGDQVAPGGNLLAPDTLGGTVPYKSGNSPNTTLAASSIAQTGNSAGHENVPPFLAINFIICTFGIYPSRN